MEKKSAFSAYRFSRKSKFGIKQYYAAGLFGIQYTRLAARTYSLRQLRVGVSILK